MTRVPRKHRKYACGVCNRSFIAGARGPLPSTCPAHRTKTSPGEHRGLNRARDQQRRKTKGLARKAAAVSSDANDAAKLARALAGLDPIDAATRVGLLARGAELDSLVREARRLYPRLVDGSVDGLVEQLDLLIALCTVDAIQHRGEISPRDLPHVIRAAASARDLLSNGQLQPRYTAVSVELVVGDAEADPSERGTAAT